MTSSRKSSQKSMLSLRWAAFLACVVAVTGATGILFVATQIYPTNASQILLLFLLFVTVGAGVIPISAYFNHRFARKQWRQKDPNRLIRQGLESGLLIVILGYLRIQDPTQGIDWTITAVLISVFILMETFFLTRS